MKFEQPLIPGTLIKRYQRFLVDVELDDGKMITAHTPNTGSMKGCCEPGSRIWLSASANPKRKYPLSWELIEVSPGVLTGINTGLPNTLIREGIESGIIRPLQGYETIRQEVRYGKERSRIDLLLEDKHKPACYVEIKNVTLAEQGIGYFPDAVSERGRKHLRELRAVVATGYRGVICFCVQREDVEEFRPADDIDGKYGETLREVLANGVEAIAYRAEVSEEAVMIKTSLPVVCP